MSNLWRRIRCSRLFKAHRWEAKLIDGEKAFECRYCHKRNFGPRPEDMPAMGGAVDGGIGSGMGAGPGF